MRMTNVERAQAVQIGDIMGVEGHRGTVTEVTHIEKEGVPCTYCRLRFYDDLKNTGYDNACYGSSDIHFDYYVGREGRPL